MNLNQLRYVLAVAQEGNFSRAAKRCHVSQPSLSVAVRNLEEELEVILFERFKHEVRVTPEGERVLVRIKQALEAVEHIRQTARGEDADPLKGSLRLGAIFTIAPYLFPGFVPELHRQAPDLTLLLEENFTAVLSEKLKRGELDAMVIALPYDEPGIVTQPIYDEPFVVGVPADHGWVDRNDLDGNDLASEQLLLLGKGHCFRDQVLEICPACHQVADTVTGMHNIIEGSSLETIRHMVASGVGITVLPLGSITTMVCSAMNCPEQSRSALRYAYFKDPAPVRRVALAWRESFPNPEIFEQVVQALQAGMPKQMKEL
ncbi:hydrogen peroxide-inducible genes activator [Magnetococcus sp. PR-3]|uniref:hydrogen peroxide-inducible genes activator n=1 Tax=Magnetococcus sp. PR-3 TaxID=3120355 RepID=UPI002FCE110E